MIHYLKGDATSPIGEGHKVIVHVCNNVGAWGAGFVLALSRKWKDPEKEYRKWSKGEKSFFINPDFELGNVQFVTVEKEITVANMIGQEDVSPNNAGVSPVRYGAIGVCLEKVVKHYKGLNMNFSIHMPRIGCGLAGGHWNVMEEIIKVSVPDHIDVYVYDFE